jgi:hypothetical protein
VEYLRWQSPAPNARGHHPGIFALVNGLSLDGRLTPAQEAYRRASNAWFHANMLDPVTVDASVYDRALYPRAAAWFKPAAAAHLARIPGYLAILAAHDVGCEVLRTTTPGRITYEDPHQIIAT